MKIFKLILLTACLTLPLSGDKCESDKIYDEFARRFESRIGNDDEKRKLLFDVSAQIARDETNIRLRALRICINKLLGNEDAERDDIYKLVELSPNSPYMLMQKCLFDEMKHGKNDDTLACYKGVVIILERDGPEARPGLKNGIYAVAALMAELPNSEEIRQQYLQSLGYSPAEEYERKFISIFRRGMFFEQNPPEALILEPQLSTGGN